MQSSYQTVATPATGRPSTDDFSLGHFVQDWEYVEGSGDLDECNGMTVNGSYGYYVTVGYPYVVGCYKGAVDESFRK